MNRLYNRGKEEYIYHVTSATEYKLDWSILSGLDVIFVLVTILDITICIEGTKLNYAWSFGR